jgi:hypothetical protein
MLKGNIEIISAAITGVSALLVAFIAWKLTNASNNKSRQIAAAKEHRDELKQLYTDVFVLFEQTMRQVWSREPFNLAQEFSEATAKIHLLAPDAIGEQYLKAAHLLEEWSTLQIKASPKQMDMGDGKTATIFQSPDPTEPFKIPAKEAHEKLQQEVQQLVKLMRSDLRHDSE